MEERQRYDKALSTLSSDKGGSKGERGSNDMGEEQTIANGSAVELMGDQLSGLAGSTVSVSATGLRLPNKMSFEKWQAFAPFFRKANIRAQSLNWLLADWLAYGGEKFCPRGEDGRFKVSPNFERYRLAAEQTGYDETTLRTWAVIARAVPEAIRRPPDRLSFKHHRVVAVLQSDEDKERWLAEAEEKRWSVSQLTMAIRASLATADRSGSVGLVTGSGLLVGLVSDMQRRVRQLRSGGPISEWPKERRQAVMLDVIRVQTRTNEICNELISELKATPTPT